MCIQPIQEPPWRVPFNCSSRTPSLRRRKLFYGHERWISNKKKMSRANEFQSSQLHPTQLKPRKKIMAKRKSFFLGFGENSFWAFFLFCFTSACRSRDFKSRLWFSLNRCNFLTNGLAVALARWVIRLRKKQFRWSFYPIGWQLLLCRLLGLMTNSCSELRLGYISRSN